MNNFDFEPVVYDVINKTKTIHTLTTSRRYTYPIF